MAENANGNYPLFMESIGSPLLWAGFVLFVIAVSALDLGVFHRTAHEVKAREAAAWSAVWIGLSGLFNIGVWAWFGPDRALEFTTGYLIEKALAVDNIFVFIVVFSAFGVAPRHQHRVLLWGILGALLMRALFILTGSAFIQRFHATLYVFGALLVFTGIRLLLQRDKPMHPERNPVVRWFSRVYPVAHGPEHEGRFFARVGGRRAVTSLFLALVAIEVTDIIFALDSIPAIFAVTTDPFIVFTSNIFAILGLRSLYFLLAGVLSRFHYLKVGISLVLVFVGGKMLIEDLFHVPILASLAAIAVLLTGSIVASLLWPKAAIPEEPPAVAATGDAGGPPINPT